MHGYALRTRASSGTWAQSSSETGARFLVKHNGGSSFSIDPSRRFFDTEGQTANQGTDHHRLPHRQRPVRDLLGHGACRAAASIKVLVNPVVDLLWFGGLLGRARHPDRDLARPAPRPPARATVRRRSPRQRAIDGAVGIVLLVALVVAAVLFVVAPLLRKGAAEQWHTTSAEQLRLVELRERRDQALLSLRELELDHDTGKLDDADYEQARTELRAEAVDALAALDEDIREVTGHDVVEERIEHEVVADPEPAADGRSGS